MTGTGSLLSTTLLGSEADQFSYSGPQTATAVGFPGELRHIFGTGHFYFWRTSWTDGWMDFFPLLSNRWGNCKLKQNLAQMFHTDTDGNSHHLLLTAWCCEHCMINIRQNKVCFWTTHISWIHFLFGLEGKNSKISKHNFGFWLIRPQEAFTSTHSITNEAQRGLLGFWPLFVFFCFAWWSFNFHLWFQHWSVVSPQSDFHYRTMCVLM